MYSKFDKFFDVFFDVLERLAIVALVSLIVLCLPGFWGVTMVCAGGLVNSVLGYSLAITSLTVVYAVARTLLTEISYNGVSPFIL
jgi:uncharacterized RDD family membrane protein YckC